MNNQVVQELQELYTEKKEQMLQLLELTRRETASITEEDVTNLEDFLNFRRKIMDHVDVLDIKIKAQITQMPEGVQKKVLRPLELEIQSIVAEIIKLDEPIKMRLGAGMHALKQKLKGLHGGKAVKQAYYPQQSQKFGYFIDKKE